MPRGGPRPVCSVPGCDKPHQANGYCPMHLRRWRLYGDPLHERPTVIDRAWAKIDKRHWTQCWPYMGSIHSSGYGVIKSGGRYASQEHKVHRLVYEDTYGAIPEGWTIDHTCHWKDDTCLGGASCLHRRCANPRHLEAVPFEVNVALARSAKRLTKEQSTHCPRGHPWDEANTYRDSRGGRQCRSCTRERMRRLRAARTVV